MNWNRIVILLVVCCTILAGATVRYQRYSNARYALAIDWPSDLMHLARTADNGDGATFQSRDGRATLLVFGAQALDQALRQKYEKAFQGHHVTYKKLGADWYVVSGQDGDALFYEKTLSRGGIFKSFILTYPATQRSTWNPVVSHLEASFRG